MHVPGMIIGVSNLGPVHLHHSGAGFNQPAGKQAALPERIFAVALAGLFLFGFQVEGFTGLAGKNQFQRFAVVFI